MTDLAELRRELFPNGRGTPPEPGPPIAWVRVMKARVPAFDALDAGDLAIVPGSALAVVAPTREDIRPLVEAFVAARVAGALLVEAEAAGSSGEVRLGELEAAVGQAGIATLRIPRGDPGTIERSVIGYVVGAAAELERQAAILEAELERRALAGDDAAALVAVAAGSFGRAIALENERGEALAVHAPAESADAGPAVAAYAAGRRDAIALRVPLPSAKGNRGALVLLGSRPASAFETAATPRIAGLVALEMARDEAVRRAGNQGARADALPSAGPPWVMLLARQRGPGPEDDAAGAREAREAVRRDLRLLAPARRLALRGDADSLEIRLVAAGSAAEDLADRAATLLGRTVALSRPFASQAERPAAEAEARATLDAALALPERPRLARAERLAAFRLLGAMHNLPDAQRLSRALLEPLLSGRPDVRVERLATLRAVLARGGVNEAAAALGVHRNTVAYRMRRIEALTGWRLTDPELRVPLAVALELVHEEQV